MNKIILASGRIIIGLVFLFSAVTKILSIDEFELYIFSLQYFGFNLSTVIARLLISLELILGVLLILNLKFRIVYKLSLGVMILFSLFLIIQFILNNNENCNCFGDLIKMNPLESLIKNILIIVLLFLIRNNKSWKTKAENKFIIIIAGVLFFIPPILSPPDFIVGYRYKNPYSISGEDAVYLSNSNLGYNEGRKVLVFVLTGCKSCNHSAKKLTTLALKSGNVDNVFLYFTGSENSETHKKISEFYDNNSIAEFPYEIVSIDESMRITGGRFPTIIFTEDAVIINKFGYRNIPEKGFYEFLQK